MPCPPGNPDFKWYIIVFGPHCSSDDKTNTSLFNVRWFIDDAAVEEAEDDLDEELDNDNEDWWEPERFKSQKVSFDSIYLWFLSAILTLHCNMFHGWALRRQCYIWVSNSTQGPESKTQNHLKWVIMITTLPILTISKIMSASLLSQWLGILSLHWGLPLDSLYNIAYCTALPMAALVTNHNKWLHMQAGFIHQWPSRSDNG